MVVTFTVPLRWDFYQHFDARLGHLTLFGVDLDAVTVEWVNGKSVTIPQAPPDLVELGFSPLFA